MAKPAIPFSITTPGFFGLNEQDSPAGMSSGFALKAKNCVIDSSGRIASRKGWSKVNSANTDLATSNVTCLGELIQNDGTSTVLAAGGAFLFKLSGATLITLTYGGGGVAPTISASNWMFTQLNGIAVFWQRGYDPLIYDPSVSTTTFRRLSEHASYSGSVPQANCALSAYGRMWCADTSTNKNTVTWSDVITPQVWTGGSSGSLNLLGVWPKGGDEIVALAAHNNFLVIFGKKQTLIYSGATTPSTMALADSIPNIGCIARDSVQNIGEDIIFLSDTGVRSLTRTIQEKSAPLRDLSRNIRDELQAHITSETLANIKSAYSPIHAFYLLTMPVNNETYCFDLRQPLDDGSLRTTDWYDITPKAFLAANNRKLYLGQAGYIGEYTGYLDDTATYRMEYYTSWIDFGNPVQKTILKKLRAVTVGSPSQTIVMKAAYDFGDMNYVAAAIIANETSISEWGTAEWGLGEWGTNVTINIINTNLGGTGQVVQFGFETEINGYHVSFQKIDVFTKEGRI